MKRLIIILLSIIAVCQFSSCNKPEVNDTLVQSEDDYYLYDLNEIASSYDIDNNGNLYYMAINPESSKGKDLQSFKPNSLLKVLNKDGVIQNIYTVPNIAGSLCLAGNKIYYIERLLTDQSNINSLSEYFTDTQTSKKICDLSDYKRINQMAVINDTLYYVGVNEQLADKEYNYYKDDYFAYYGERIGYVDLSTGALEELPIELPITFSKTLDGNLMIYAYDEEGGYYFTEYDTKEKSLKEKVYHDLGQLGSFEIFNEDNDYLYVKIKSDSFALATGTIVDKDEGAELMPDVQVVTSLIYKDGFTYKQTIDGKHILRIRNASYFRSNEKISMLSPNYYDIHVPFGCGYSIKNEYKSDEEMALSVLSQDSSFDLFFMDSNQVISSNIRDKGSFYPLNDVKGVKEYLDACFPYIKDIATDADGNIWMIPIAVNIPCLFYNENKCREYEIEFNNSMNLDNLMQIITKLKQDTQTEQLYNYYGMRFFDSLMYQYTRTYTDFDNQLFRDLAKTLKSDFNYMTDSTFGNDMLWPNLTQNGDDNFLFFYENDLEFQYKVTDVTGVEGIRACGLPSITDNHTNTATCLYLCVNPASKNLKTTLQYISSVCSYLLTLDDTLMFSDRNKYKDGKLVDDLYAIYANGDIRFTYPNDIFKDDLEKYFTDEKDLESVIEDSNRRLEIYLNE